MILRLVLTYSLLLILPLQVVRAETSPDPSALNCSQTFLSIFPDCVSDRETPRSAAQLLQTDLKVCSCIDESPILRAALDNVEPDTNTLKKKRSDEALDTENYIYDSLVIHGAQIAETQEDSDKMMMANSGSGGKEVTAEMRRSLDPESSERGAIDKRVTEMNNIPAASSGQQCVTFNEYNALRIIPQSSDFYRRLQGTEFQSEEWNIEALSRRYDSVTDQTEKTGISERIHFLQRNPQIRYVFMAQASGAITQDQVLERQRAVYNALRLLVPPTNSSCLENNSCRDEAIRDGRHAAFSSQLAGFFKNDPVLDDMTNAAQLLDIETQVRNLINSPLGAGANNIQEYFHNFQRDNGDLAQRCSGFSADTSCYTDFRDHCSNLRRFERQIQKNEKLNGNSLLRNIRAQDRAELNLELSQNLTFQDFNDQICLQVFSNSSGEELNFFGYQDRYCSGANPLPECGDRRALVRRFLLEYSSGEGEEILSNRASLAGLIQDQNFVDISTGALEAANRLNETPAQLRERFGGLYPRVSPSGTLLPPLPSSGSAGSSANSIERPRSSAANFTQPVSPVTSNNQVSNPFAASSSRREVSRAPARGSQSSSGGTSSISPASSSTSSALDGNAFTSRRPAGTITEPFVSDSSSDSSVAKTSPPSVNQRPDSNPVEASSARSPARAAQTSAPSANQRTNASQISSSGFSAPPVRPREEFSRVSFSNRALMERYKSSEDMQFLPMVDFKNLNLRQEDLTRYGENVQLLARNPDVIRMVSESERGIVELTVTGKNGQEIVVFAKKEAGGIVIYESLYGATRDQGRSIASVSSEFRVHVKPQTFEYLRADPNGILLESSIYERVLYSEEDELKVFLTSDEQSPLTLSIRKESDGGISVKAN